jgi:hypothetical protein
MHKNFKQATNVQCQKCKRTSTKDSTSSKTALGGRDLVMAASENDITLVNAHAVLNCSWKN